MNKGFVLDTDTVSFYLRKKETVVEQFKKAIQGELLVGITLITHYEILSGLKFKHSEKYLKSYLNFSKELNIYPLTEKSVELSSEIYASLRKKVNPLDYIDILIAGIAIENKNILVTGNATHFGRIKGLNIENWITR